MNKNQLKAVLKINGFDEHSSDEEIRAVLLNAKYTDEEIETALRVLRQSDAIALARSDGLHTVFYTDEHLKPREIAGLLGIEVNLDFPLSKYSNKYRFTLLEGLAIIALSIAVAALLIVGYMFFYEVGLFHPVLSQQ